VNPGTANNLAYYPSSGNVVDDISGVSWDTSNTGNLLISGNVIVAKTVSANQFSSTAVGTPTLTSGSDIVMSPAGSLVINGPTTLKSYTVVQLASVSPAAGSMAYCTNESGGAVPVFYDGTNWRRVTDRAIAS
jgi:hypothetical protein